MDFSMIAQLIGSYGFPVVCCIAMGFYVREQTNKNSEMIATMNREHSEELRDLTEKHKNEIDKVTEALQNNTLALTRLCDKLEAGVKNV